VRKEEIKMSYAAADVPFPAKLLHHKKLIESVVDKHYIPPIHIQLNPENACNFNCPFCSCANRDKSLRLSYDEIMEVMETGKELGTESVTITGGGEPTMHPEINEIILGIAKLGIEQGLVPNGTLLDRVKTEALQKLTWCRISSSDHLKEQLERIGMTFNEWLDKVEDAVTRAPKVDWAFSHVVCRRPDYETIKTIVDFANRYNFTHVRLVNNIFVADQLAWTMPKIKEELKKAGIDDSRVNYQARSTWTKGAKKCYISLLKPVLGADGYWYPCCGTQYALAKPSYDYEPKLRLTEKRLAEGLREIITQQKYLDGSICVKCYYHPYNWALKVMLSEVKHLKFV